MEKNKKEEAISAIVRYNTLPPQIDYKRPQLNAAIKAEKYIDLLPEKEREEAFNEVKRQIDDYFTPNILGTDGIYRSAYNLNSMF